MSRLLNFVPYRFRYWKIEYQLWAARPSYFGAIALVLFIGMLMTSVNWGIEGAQLRESTGIQRSIATAFEKVPGILLKQLEAKKDSMSAYQYELQYQQYRYFARNSPRIAQRIRDDAFWNIFKGIGGMVGKEAAQMAAGKIAGKAANVVFTRIGYGVSRAGSALADKGYNVAGRFIAREGDELIWGAQEISEKLSNLAFEVTSTATRNVKWNTPKLQMAMARPEFAELFQLIQKATEQNPDKLMEAALHQCIKMAGNAKDRPDDEYRTSVMITAQNLKKLTKEGGSPDSMWNDVNELAKWIANKVGKPLPDEPEPEDTPESSIPEPTIVEFPDKLGNYMIRLTFPKGECQYYETIEVGGSNVTNLLLEEAFTNQKSVEVEIEVLGVSVNQWRLRYRYNLSDPSPHVRTTIKDYPEATTEFRLNVGPVDKEDGDYGDFYLIRIDGKKSGSSVFVLTHPENN
jgi:hypothetical protein